MLPGLERTWVSTGDTSRAHVVTKTGGWKKHSETYAQTSRGDPEMMACPGRRAPVGRGYGNCVGYVSLGAI